MKLRRTRNPLIKCRSEKEPLVKDRARLKTSRRLKELYRMNPLFMPMTNSHCQKCSQVLLGPCTSLTLMPLNCRYRYQMGHTPGQSPQPTSDILWCSSPLQQSLTTPPDGVACQSLTTPTSFLEQHSIRLFWPIQEPLMEHWPWPSFTKETFFLSPTKASSTQQTSK